MAGQGETERRGGRKNGRGFRENRPPAPVAISLASWPKRRGRAHERARPRSIANVANIAAYKHLSTV